MAQYWEGSLVRLRSVEPGDAPVHHAFNLSADYGWLDQIYPPQWEGKVEEWASSKAKAPFAGDAYSFQIESVADGTLVGHIATHHIDRRVGTFEYGISVMEGHRGQGYAREAICLVLRYYFQELRYQKVNVEVMDGNLPSLRLHESMGYVREGTRRNSAFTFGALRDMVLFGMTSDEFRELFPEYWREIPPDDPSGVA